MNQAITEGMSKGQTVPTPEPLSPEVSKPARGDLYFRWLTAVCALVLPLIMIAIGLALAFYSIPALRKFGLGFFISQEWNIKGGFEKQRFPGQAEV